MMKNLTTNEILNTINKINKGDKITRRNVYYHNGNHEILGNINIIHTKKELYEYSHCLVSIEYFMFRYLNINMTSSQKKIIEKLTTYRNLITNYEIDRNNDIKEIFGIYLLHKILFDYNKSIMICGIEETRVKIKEIILKYYRKLPLFLKVGFLALNSRNLNTVSGIKIFLSPCSKYAGSGMKLNEVYIFDVNESSSYTFKNLFPVVHSAYDSKFVIAQANATEHKWLSDMIHKTYLDTGNVYKVNFEYVNLIGD